MKQQKQQQTQKGTPSNTPSKMYASVESTFFVNKW
jgi:hypothetical protein